MNEQPRKIVPMPDAKMPEAKRPPGTEPPAAETKAGLFARINRGRLRMILLVGLPALAALIGLFIYLSGGRYISTDNAYVGAQKVLITSDISGKIAHIAVREGQHVNPGDELFTLDPQPYRLALEQAQADLDTAASGLVTAKLELAFTQQQRDTTLNQLLGNPNLPLEQFPEYAQAKAAVADAERNLNHTVVRSAISGIATQVDNIQLGRFIAAGSPVFSVIDDQAPWVDANPKETDITYLRIGQKVSIEVDSFPDHTFNGTVVSVSPGTGAQFSILPPQNATGN